MQTKIERISKLERKYVLEVLDTQFSSSKGASFMRRFESEFSQKYNNYNAISFVNGTATMHAALEAAGIGPGDEVIVPPLTMASTTFAVLQANASPIFADIDPDTFQIDPEDIRRKITPDTKAIITVALYGGSPKLDKIKSICDANQLFLLEDNAECFGATYKNIPVGCYGDAASFSFQSSKHLTAGEGGVLLVQNDVLAGKVRSFQSLGYVGVGAKVAKISKNSIQEPSYKRHCSLGFNYRMPELCAAVALAQTKRMEELVAARVEVAKRFNSVAKGFSSIIEPQKNYTGATNSYWTWAFKLNEFIDWNEFKLVHSNFGGDPFYGAWALTFDETFIIDRNLYNRERFLTAKYQKNWASPECPNASSLQGRLCQFQTNIFDINHLDLQAEALHKTLMYFSG
jgi:perosamine synthetase